jgi:hypothetical protein
MQNLLFAFRRDLENLYPAAHDDVKTASRLAFGENDLPLGKTARDRNGANGLELFLGQAAEKGCSGDDVHYFFHGLKKNLFLDLSQGVIIQGGL